VACAFILSFARAVVLLCAHRAFIAVCAFGGLVSVYAYACAASSDRMLALPRVRNEQSLDNNVGGASQPYQDCGHVDCRRAGLLGLTLPRIFFPPPRTRCVCCRFTCFYLCRAASASLNITIVSHAPRLSRSLRCVTTHTVIMDARAYRLPALTALRAQRVNAARGTFAWNVCMLRAARLPLCDAIMAHIDSLHTHIPSPSASLFAHLRIAYKHFLLFALFSRPRAGMYGCCATGGKGVSPTPPLVE